MQELLEVIRVTKSADTGIVDKTRKIVEWRDVIGVEEAGVETLSDTDEDNLTLLNLSYMDVLVTEDYHSLVKKWKKYKQYAKEEDNNINNFRAQN
jgi:hypothetical protein